MSNLNPNWIAFAVAALAWLALTRFGKVSVARAKKLLANGAKLVDVRSPGEFASGHIDGAENLPLDRLASHAPALAAEQRPILVYCASGLRSASAKRVLRSAGVADVHDLGGIGRWR